MPPNGGVCVAKQVLRCPWPPSVNRIWRSVNGRAILSADYRAWRKAASQELMLVQRARPQLGPVEITIELCPPNKRVIDIDNRAKACIDLLVSCGIIEADDSSVVRKVVIELGEGFTGARLHVEPCL